MNRLTFPGVLVLIMAAYTGIALGLTVARWWLLGVLP